MGMGNQFYLIFIGIDFRRNKKFIVMKPNLISSTWFYDSPSFLSYSLTIPTCIICTHSLGVLEDGV